MHAPTVDWLIDKHVLLFSSLAGGTTASSLRHQIVPYLEEGADQVHVVIDLRAEPRAAQMISMVVRLAGELEKHPKYGSTTLMTQRGTMRFSFKESLDAPASGHYRDNSLQRALQLLQRPDYPAPRLIGGLAVAQ